MPTDALALALGAAALHALWNLLLARSIDVQAATGAALVISVVVFAPVAAATWRVEVSAWPFLVSSSALELVYFALLAAAYRRADLSLVYPLTRGLAPLLVLAASVAFLGAGSSAVEAIGVFLVAAGIVLVRGLAGRADLRALALTAAIACCIAGYTLVDRYGIRHANAIAYLELVLIGPAVAYPLLLGVGRARRGLRPSTAVSGVAMLGGYALVLVALRLASAASVAAVRESSIVIAVALAAIVLREPVGRGRLAGAVLVAGGVATIALG